MANQPFRVEGMTINEIMALGDDTLRTFSARDMSRAVRTLALAANKRAARLSRYGYKRGGKWVEKKGGPGVDFNALYGMTSKFGVKGATNLNDLRKEFARTKAFLQAPSSTVKGAVALRKQKEIALFGETREAIIKRMNKAKKAATGRNLTQKEIWEILKNRNELMSDVYDAFHYWKEEYQLVGGYDTATGNKALAELGERMNNGMSADDAREEVSALFDEQYERSERARQGLLQNRLTDKENR